MWKKRQGIDDIMIEEFKYVSDNSKYVHIDINKIDNFVNSLGDIKYVHWSEEINLDLNEKEWILLSFIIESMNFCFWKKPKWKIEYNNQLMSGSNALFYSVIKCVEKDKNFLNIDYLNNLDFNSFKNIFEGEEVCPLLEERYNNFKETISYIKNHDFYNELFSIKSDIELRSYIVDNFSHFNDKSIYKDKEIHFNKRATLLVNDLYRISSTIKNNIGNVDNLTGCADYAIPRIFRDYGLLVYNDELSNLIDSEELIKHDSEMEIEIRANMLYLIELIKEKVNINSIELDSIIWDMGHKIPRKSNSHHTITIYY